MNKKFNVILFTISYILGITAFLLEYISIFAILFFIILILLIYKKYISEKFAITLFLMFFVGIINVSFKLTNLDELSAISPKNDVSITGKVISLPSSSSNEYTKFIVNVEKYNLYNQTSNNTNSKILVTLFTTPNLYQNIEMGDKISLTGRLTKTKKATNPSEFCYATYLKFQNIHSRLYVQDGNFSIIEKPKNSWLAFLSSLNRIRSKIIAMHSQNIKSPELELLGGIVFGDDAITPTPEMKESFQKSGLTHIIAASGMNVSMIFGMWFFLSQILKINYKISIITGILSVICYTCMTGFGPPILRATLMLILVLIGKLIDRKSDSVTLLFIVAFLMLLFSPTMLTNIGFQLSFIVTLGLLICAPILFDNIKNKILCTILSFIAIPIISQIFAAPIQMFYFNSFSPYSLLANISVVPTLSFVSFIGFTSCIFAMIKPISFISVKFFDFILTPFLSFITTVADFFSNLPYSSVVVPSPSIIQIFLYYITVLSFIFFILYKKNTKIVLITATVSFILLLISIFPIKNNNNEIIFFNVENADAALIRTSQGKNILIDTGKAPYKKFSPAAEKIILKYFEDKGINKLDLMVLTHFDSDHSGGATFILEKIKIDKLLVRTINDESILAREIIKKAKENNIHIETAKNNHIIFDDSENKMYSYIANNGDDNDKSIVNLYETKTSKILFTGDSGTKYFKEIKNYLPNDIDILKVAHHGAKDSISKEYLKHLKPEIAIISTGFNIYGHPDKKVINLLNEFNIKTLRTDMDNAIKIIMNQKGILLYSYNNRHKKFERIKND